ncbi:uncharacterized protein [Lolium perenne]|uniref:uncharacterized protein n=1 Tax=Lolium perenne TaxID=4522 RepID=UPI003A99DDF6
MENLSPESKALYQLLRSETKEEYEIRFASYKKELLDAVKVFVDDTTEQITDVRTTIDGVRTAVSTDFQAAKESLGAELDAVKTSLSSEIAGLAAAVDRAMRCDPGAVAGRPSSSASKEVDARTAGPEGRHWDPQNRGTNCAQHTNSPEGGTNFDRNFFPQRQYNISRFPGSDSHNFASGFRFDLPHFDGANPKLWQRRCEEQFRRNLTASNLWVTLAADQFMGAAATWLGAFLHQYPQPSWMQFTEAVLARFSRNQHPILSRRLFHIRQETTIEDYVSRFSELMDQISVYEGKPDPVHYTTKFIDGLQSSVRVLVAIQQPKTLEVAYSLALMYEELGDDNQQRVQPIAASASRRSISAPPPPPPPPSKWVSRTVEEKKVVDSQKPASVDKWNSLRAYRRSKNLCFTCGEKYSREHQCKSAIQLHVVQEMIDYMRSCTDSDEDTLEADQEPVNQQVMMLSVAAVSPEVSAPRTMQLKVYIQGHDFLFLVDSGSSACFIDEEKAKLLTGLHRLPIPVSVKVAGGAVLQSTTYFPDLQWSADGAKFSDTFRVLRLGSYDGIIGLDWLGKYSPMMTHWEQGWLGIQHEGQQVILHGEGEILSTHALIELHLIREAQTDQPVELPRETEIERQIKELLDQGVITHSNSAFGSPILLVKKADHTWRLVVDYRHLNALTVKGKYPLPIIDELLDELAGVHWFSKLDLRAGYHQIRLAPGEEYKTAFQSHNGHYEFKVMAFGLTGAPATFQHAMNASLAPVLRKFALVFFDDILIYSATYEEHLQHLSTVLGILKRDQWQVKRSKCAFAHQ